MRRKHQSSYLLEGLESRCLLAGLTAQYFDRVDFADLKLSRTDAVVDFTWAGAPDPAVGADNFSVRWTGQVEAQFTENYTFYVNSDDGARLWVDGRLVIDNWVNQLPTEKSAAVALEAGKRYDIRMDYYEANLGAQASLSWSSATQPKQIIPSSRLFTAPSGLRATLYDNADFTVPRVSRTDSIVDFTWGSGSPDPTIGADTFSARWTGEIIPLYSQTYTFYAATDADATVRLRVDGELLIDSTSVQDGAQIKLEAGKRYDIRLDYAEATGTANVKLEWSSPSQSKQVIPSTRLFAATDTSIPSRLSPYTNSVLNFDRPDPGVIFADGAYWMVHTTGGPDNGWPLYKSTDLTSWTFVTNLLTSSNKPAWMTDAFWAPEIHKIGDLFVLTGTSYSALYGHLAIALATSPELAGPYTVQPTAIVVDTRNVLDSHIFQDHDGRVFLVWKRDGPSNGDFGSIRLREMNSSGTAFLAGSVETTILSNTGAAGWENNLQEAPWMIHRGQYYYLFFSGANIDTTYADGVARATSITGPYTRYSANPIITSNATWGGPGHGGFALDNDGTVWHLYHARPQSNPNYGRVQMLDRVVWTSDEWPTYAGGSPSTTLQAGPRVSAVSGTGRITINGNTLTADVFQVVRNATDSSLLDVIQNGATVRSVPFAEIEQLTIDGKGMNDTLTLDFSRGDVVPGAGLSFIGGSGTDTLRIIGESADDVLRHAAGQATRGSGILTYATTEKVAVENGMFHFDADTALATLDVSGQAIFHAAQALGALNILSGGDASLDAGGARVLRTNTLTLGATTRLDLNNNDLVVNSGNFATLQALVLGGYRSSPDTAAVGIVSTTSQTIHSGTTILALFDNSLAGFADFPSGSGNSIATAAIAGKYTYIGDTNYDGQVSAQDYTAIDANIGTSVDPGISWFYGDTNFDGNIDATDYTGIDAALGLGQGNPLAVLAISPLLRPAAPTFLALQRDQDLFP